MAPKATTAWATPLRQSLFLLRSGAGLTATLALVEAQARHEGVSRARLVQRINSAKTFVTPELTAERKVLNDRWAPLKSNADVPDAKGTLSAVKEARLALVVAVLVGVNLWKISQSVSIDPKVQWPLRAAQMATTDACIDVAATAIKGASALKDTAVSFQLLKVAGELSFTAAVGYCGPMFEELAKRHGREVLRGSAARAAAWLAARGFMYRAVFTGLSITLSIVGLAIQFAIWKYSDKALAVWMEGCAFGINPEKGWTTDLQKEKLLEACQDQGVAT